MVAINIYISLIAAMPKVYVYIFGIDQYTKNTYWKDANGNFMMSNRGKVSYTLVSQKQLDKVTLLGGFQKSKSYTRNQLYNQSAMDAFNIDGVSYSSTYLPSPTTTHTPTHTPALPATHTLTHSPTLTHTHAHSPTLTHPHPLTHTHIRTYAHTHVRTYICTHIRTHLRTHKRTHIRTHKRTHARTHIRTHMRR